MPKIKLFKVTGSQIGIRIDDFIYLFLIGLFCLVWFKRYRERRVLGETKEKYCPLVKTRIWRSDKLLVFLFFYLAWLALTTSLAWHRKDIAWHLGLLHFIRQVQYISLLVIGRWLVQTKQAKIGFYWLLAVSFAVNLFYAVLQRLQLVPYFTTLIYAHLKNRQTSMVTPDMIDQKLIGTFGGHYDFGIYLVLGLILLVACYRERKKYKSSISRSEKIGWLTGLLFLIYLLLESRSRASLLSLVVLVAGVSTPWLTAWRWLVYNLVALGGGVWASSFWEKYKFFHFGSLSFWVDESNFERLNKWVTAGKQIANQPVFGYGLSKISFALDNHYLRFLVESGVPGLLLFGLVIWQILKKAKNQQNLMGRAIFYFTLALLADAMFIDIFVSSKIMYLYWSMIGIFLFAPLEAVGKPAET